MSSIIDGARDLELSENRTQMYRCCELSCNKITTLIFGGGGVYGFLYLGLIKFLEENNLLADINFIIGVSVGSIISLYLALGYTYTEIYNSIMYDIKLEKILEINADNIFNILDQLGINNGAYVEETIKNIISSKGFSPYLTFKDLMDAQCGPELNIGYTRSFHNDFFMSNARTTPNMPIWLAIRASIAIPIILTPVIDYISHDILCDGGLVNNTPIKWYLADWWSQKEGEHKDCVNKPIKTYLDAETQTDIILVHHKDTSDNKDEESKPAFNNTSSMVPNDVGLELTTTASVIHNKAIIPQKKKYKQHFWCLEIKTLTDSPITCTNDLKSVTLPTYLSWVIHKIFANQDASRDKYSKYLCQLDSKNYPEINREVFNLDNPTRNLIINRSYEEYKKYYYNYLLISPHATQQII